MSDRTASASATDPLATPRYRTTWDVLYYETDRMGIVHHSNYIRYFEIARVRFLRALDCSYERLEAMGVEGPVVSVSARYVKPASFGDTLTIELAVSRYTGVRLAFTYRIVNGDGETVCVGESEHAFTRRSDHRVIALPRELPEADRIFREALERARRADREATGAE